MKKIVIHDKTVYYFDHREFEVNGTPFRIIGTAITGPGYHDCIHTIKNLLNGKYQELEMITLVALFRKYNLI